MNIKEIGSFYIAGELVTVTGMPVRARASTSGGTPRTIDPNGEMIVGQMYVQFVRLASPTSAHPLMLWHGGGMTGVTWESTPDGRPGWQMFFLQAGFDVYVPDAVERGRSSWAPYPQVYPDAPFFRVAREAWEETFRFGPAGSWHVDPTQRRMHTSLRFPADRIETFISQFVPRWSNNDALTQRAYNLLVERVTPAIVLAHSQGGHFALQTALHKPEHVKALIVLEPSDAPDPDFADAGAPGEVPHLFIWGDHLERHAYWQGAAKKARRWYDALGAAGTDVEWIDLPALGIRGNSHALMADDNSDEIATLICDWLQRHK